MLKIAKVLAHHCVMLSLQQNEYGNEEEDDENDEDQISEVCENLYTASAKCNKNFDDATASSYQGNNQYTEEDMVCDYITSLLEGNYDESGSIVIDANWYFNVSNWREASEYMNEFSNAKNYIEQNVQPWQTALLVLSSVGCFMLWIWACCLHSSLRRRNIPWKPRRTKDMTAQDISRQNSGIVLGRSQSGPGAGLAPLI